MDFIRNLREETIAVLKEHGKKWSDVVGVCGNDFQITKEQFWELANKRYDYVYARIFNRIFWSCWENLLSYVCNSKKIN